MDHFLASRCIPPILMLVLFTNVPGCASNSSTLHAHGTIADLTMTARVDHPVAQDYLEGRPLPADLEELRRVHILGGQLPWEPALTHLTKRYSTDVATLFFVEAVGAHDQSSSIQREYTSAVRRIIQTGENPDLDLRNPRLTVVFAPGWFYKTYGAETGADFQRQLRQLARAGVPAELIETDENGTVEANAAIIAESLLRLRRDGRGGRCSLSAGASLVPRWLSRLEISFLPRRQHTCWPG